MMKPEYELVMESPVGRLAAGFNRQCLATLDFVGNHIPLLAAHSAPARKLQVQISSYFRDARSGFEIPLSLQGTDFQRRVWEALSNIPSGQPLTYGELARQLNTSARAIGGACRANPVPLVIPCHRVVAASGPGGFAGQTAGRKLAIKRWLLAHEQA
jgi:methylated-DNA-[protein]-cysteine S-methyltransferase